MARSEKGSKGRDKAGNKHKKKKSDKTENEQLTTQPIFSLLADETRVDPALSSLFATKSAPAVPKHLPPPIAPIAPTLESEDGDEDEDSIPLPAEKSFNVTIGLGEQDEDEDLNKELSKRKRKRKHEDHEDLEDTYMHRLVREEVKEAEATATERAAKRQKSNNIFEDPEESDADQGLGTDTTLDTADALDEDVGLSPPPQHETQQSADLELEKAKRTVFLGNVSTSAISSKSSRKVLIDHLKSIFPSVSGAGDGDSKHAVESIRFRSTPYASAMPKKAAFARKEVMDATTKSTNAYAVYSSPFLAREAVLQLNGSVILGRHLRVDSIAHPAPVDNRRCVFVGNLGFVDDESNIQAANEEEGARKRKRKEAADVEEGLWRTFGKYGPVESVRVIRDSATRVGKGIAYVQFEDGNAVEAALALNDKKFPPMLPRKLRVSRAKAVNRNAKPTARPGTDHANSNGYRSRATAERASRAGRAGKLYGKAAAAQVRIFKPARVSRSERSEGAGELPNGVVKPEAFVFEGHRARSKGGKAGLKFGKKKGAKPTNRSARRGAVYKAGNKKPQK